MVASAGKIIDGLVELPSSDLGVLLSFHYDTNCTADNLADGTVKDLG